jgi:hypothetical protein
MIFYTMQTSYQRRKTHNHPSSDCRIATRSITSRIKVVVVVLSILVATVLLIVSLIRGRSLVYLATVINSLSLSLSPKSQTLDHYH